MKMKHFNIRFEIIFKIVKLTVAVKTGSSISRKSAQKSELLLSFNLISRKFKPLEMTVDYVYYLENSSSLIIWCAVKCPILGVICLIITHCIMSDP